MSFIIILILICSKGADQRIERPWNILAAHTLPIGRSRAPKTRINTSHSCDLSFGVASFVTGSAGLLLASATVKYIAHGTLTPPSHFLI
jgi:hypothetical protein